MGTSEAIEPKVRTNLDAALDKTREILAVANAVRNSLSEPDTRLNAENFELLFRAAIAFCFDIYII
jgi:hypothetical protein